MLESLLNSLGKVGNSIGESTREKTLGVIEDWLTIFPQLAAYDLEITSFGMGLAISPSLNVELLGSHANWSDEAIEQRLAAHKGEHAISMVLSTIKTAYRLQRKTRAELRDPLILKIKVKISPEVRVVLGQPVLED